MIPSLISLFASSYDQCLHERTEPQPHHEQVHLSSFVIFIDFTCFISQTSRQTFLWERACATKVQLSYILWLLNLEKNAAVRSMFVFNCCCLRWQQYAIHSLFLADFDPHATTTYQTKMKDFFHSQTLD